MSDPEFLQILSRARAGDQYAIGILVERAQPPLLCLCRRVLHPRLRSLREDVVQNTWISFLSGNPFQKPFASFHHFLSFLFSIAHHRAQDANRHYLDVKKRSLQGEQSLDELPVATVGRLSRYASSCQAPNVEKELLEDLLAQQSPEGSVALLLRWEGFHIDAIAASLDSSPRSTARLVGLGLERGGEAGPGAAGSAC